MSKVIKSVTALIEDSPDRHCNRLTIEKTPDGYHIHFRNLKIQLNESEFAEWRIAFSIAKEKIVNEKLFQGDI